MTADRITTSTDVLAAGTPTGTGLSHQECLSLLADGGLGRNAVNLRALPAILLVRYWLDHDRVMFHVRAEPTLDRATQDAVIAFQTDGSDDAGPWTVALTGIAHHVAAEVPEGPPSRPDVTHGGSARTVAITTDYVTGVRGAQATGEQM